MCNGNRYGDCMNFCNGNWDSFASNAVFANGCPVEQQVTGCVAADNVYDSADAAHTTNNDDNMSTQTNHRSNAVTTSSMVLAICIQAGGVLML